MATKPLSPVGWVQVLQSLVARELVDRLGVSGRRAAELLGVAPSAISQYLSGRRQKARFPTQALRHEAVRTARGIADHLADLPAGHAAPPRVLLEAAAQLAERAGEVDTIVAGADPAPPDQELLRTLRHRVRGEQAAVASCMQLAQKARDEFTRAIFRQIAADSLRHAEIVASLASDLGRGTSVAYASGITRRDVERLIEKEKEAEGEGGNLSRTLGGTMSLLAASMEADERKHDLLLKGLLESGFVRS